MNRADRERAIAIINSHIEAGKQFIRDKRFMAEVLQRDYHRYAMKFRFPWKTYATFEYNMGILLRELNRARDEIYIQQGKNTQLRQLRESIMIRVFDAVDAPLLITDMSDAPIIDVVATPV